MEMKKSWEDYCDSGFKINGPIYDPQHGHVHNWRPVGKIKSFICEQNSVKPFIEVKDKAKKGFFCSICHIRRKQVWEGQKFDQPYCNIEPDVITVPENIPLPEDREIKYISKYNPDEKLRIVVQENVFIAPDNHKQKNDKVCRDIKNVVREGLNVKEIVERVKYNKKNTIPKMNTFYPQTRRKFKYDILDYLHTELNIPHNKCIHDYITNIRTMAKIMNNIRTAQTGNYMTVGEVISNNITLRHECNIYTPCGYKWLRPFTEKPLGGYITVV